MNPLTSVIFILIGLTIILRNSYLKSDLKLMLHLFISLVILVPVLLTLANYLFGITFNANRFFSNQRASTFKMSAAPAIAITFTGIAWLLLNTIVLKSEIDSSDLNINSDFSECKTILYLLTLIPGKYILDCGL